MHDFNPHRRLNLAAPNIIGSHEISIVMPVKDNQRGVEHFLEDLLQCSVNGQLLPLEVIIVCDGNKISLQPKFANFPVEINILNSGGSGPATARNVGWREARGDWVLFTDSDCRPTLNWLKGYVEASNGAIGYAGNIRSFGKDLISRYYESQCTLMPPAKVAVSDCSPEYLITANALVWKKALETVGGFDERIKIAAGEDIDLGFRLREVGSLSFAQRSVILHDFDDGLFGFIRRFRRYGKGNHALADKYGLDIKPTAVLPKQGGFVNYALASLQYLSMLWGWYFDLNNK